MDTENFGERTSESCCGRPRRKHLFWIVPAMLAALLAGGWFGVTCAVENAARRCFAEASCQLFGREAGPQEVSYSFSGQELRISKVRVDNPPGFSQKRPAVEVGLIVAHVAPQDLLFKRVIRLKELILVGANINAEVKMSPVWAKRVIDARVNLFELKKNAPASPRPKEPLRFRIDVLRVEKGKVLLGNLEDCRSALAGKFGISLSERWTARSLDGYKQTDLGTDKPLTADEAAAVIFERHREEIIKYFEDIKNGLWEEARTLIQEKVMPTLGPFREAAGQIWKKTEKTVKETFDEKVKPAVDGLMKQMQGWFDRK